MAAVSGILLGTQIVLTFFIGFYLFNNIKNGGGSFKVKGDTPPLENEAALLAVKQLRKTKLSEPLTEKTRPGVLKEIVGQEQGMRALQAALFGANPRHVIIYGPPGCGKTASARVILEGAKASPNTPFTSSAPFVEVDGAALQFDERGVADPLIGSVHDPIYQGAGDYGGRGIPYPHPGAVTKAHGGVLFIDEIGELNHRQMNRLLKVLEDRRVTLNSSYYSSGNRVIPPHIHEIFQKGLPADFRLIGATTRKPEELPLALRSRCVEVFFQDLDMESLVRIGENACLKVGITDMGDAPEKAARYARSGRDAVNIMQTVISLAGFDGRKSITAADVELAASLGKYIEKSGGEDGVFAVAEKARKAGQGKLLITGGGVFRDAVDIACTLMKRFDVCTTDYDIHVECRGNPGGAAVFIALYSAVTGLVIPGRLGITGDISINGRLEPAGAVCIPPMTNVRVETAEQLLAAVFGVKINMRLDNDKKPFFNPGHVI